MSTPIIRIEEKGAGFEVTVAGYWIATCRDRSMAEIVRTALRLHFAESAEACLPEETIGGARPRGRSPGETMRGVG